MGGGEISSFVWALKLDLSGINSSNFATHAFAIRCRLRSGRLRLKAQGCMILDGANSCDGYRRIASENCRCDLNH